MNTTTKPYRVVTMRMPAGSPEYARAYFDGCHAT